METRLDYLPKRSRSRWTGRPTPCRRDDEEEGRRDGDRRRRRRFSRPRPHPQAKIGKRLLQYSAWLSNRTKSKRLGCAPLQRLPNPPALDLHHARPMGCRVWAHQPSVHVEGAMDDTSRAGIFVGLSELYKGVIV